MFEFTSLYDKKFEKTRERKNEDKNKTLDALTWIVTCISVPCE